MVFRLVPSNHSVEIDPGFPALWRAPSDHENPNLAIYFRSSPCKKLYGLGSAIARLPSTTHHGRNDSIGKFVTGP